MLILTSPAKTLDFEKPFESPIITQPLFLSQTEKIASLLKSYSQKKLAQVLEVSAVLAERNYERYQQWSPTHNLKNSRPAVIAYNGDIFKPMNPRKYTKEEAAYSQRSLRIISGLYGFVRGYDLIQPYRLEMKAVVPVGGKKNLYEFWTDVLTEELNKEITQDAHSHVINLASDEYGNVIQYKKLKCPVITIEFRQRRNGEIRNVGLLSKKARGMMIEYMTKHLVEKREDLRGFNTSGYALTAEAENELVFTREQ